MKTKRIIGIIILIAGLVMEGFSFYIKKQVAEGNIEIESAQSKLDRSQGLFGSNPVAKEFGKALTGSAQSKINQGRRDVDYYTRLANNLQIGGIICIVVGAGILVIGRKKR